MKIKVKDLEANPFRQIKKYPIDREKVKALKISIGETSFWDNIIVRKEDKHFQIAYGHHRLIALRELKIKEVNIPVRELDDGTMIKIMANENMDTWKTKPSVINETVLVAKEYLDKELAKCENWKEFKRANKSISSLIDGIKGFRSAKGQGVGQTTILKFLGGNWKQWMIQEALATFREDKEEIIDKDAVEEFDSLSQAKVFRKAVKDYHIPKVKQKKLAKEIIKKDVGERNIANEVRKTIPKREKPVKDPKLATLEKEIIKVEEIAKRLSGILFGVNEELEGLGVTQMTGIQSFFTGYEISLLLPPLKEFISFFQSTKKISNFKMIKRRKIKNA